MLKNLFLSRKSALIYFGTDCYAMPLLQSNWDTVKTTSKTFPKPLGFSK